MALRPRLNFVRLNGRLSIFEQLQLEEALFRVSNQNWCLLNHGTFGPYVVVGLGGKVQNLVHVDRARSRKVPVVRRYTGGGTVVVDDDTVFVSLIGNEPDVKFGFGPRHLMEWSAQFYKPVFDKVLKEGHSGPGKLPVFELRENDYVIEDRKFGGNAQGLSRERFVHHTSFLWKFNDLNMELLTLPSKRPDYRGDRDHKDFLCTLSEFSVGKDSLYDAVAARLCNIFDVNDVPLEEARMVMDSPDWKRKCNVLVDLDSL